VEQHLRKIGRLVDVGCQLPGVDNADSRIAVGGGRAVIKIRRAVVIDPKRRLPDDKRVRAAAEPWRDGDVNVAGSKLFKAAGVANGRSAIIISCGVSAAASRSLTAVVSGRSSTVTVADGASTSSASEAVESTVGSWPASRRVVRTDRSMTSANAARSS
jgi:hypothetical protein